MSKPNAAYLADHDFKPQMVFGRPTQHCAAHDCYLPEARHPVAAPPAPADRGGGA
jgi:hypothetical protein